MKRRASQKRSPTGLLLDRRAIRHLAGRRSYQRGEDYYVNRRVGPLTEQRGRVAATVQGSGLYGIELWSEEGTLHYSCTCPLGQEGLFCKHCVAVALASLYEKCTSLTSDENANPALTMDDVQKYLADRNKEELVEMLMDQAAEDDRLRQRLFMQAARINPAGPNLATYRRAIDEAVDTGGFVEYRLAYDYASGIEEVMDSIQNLLGEGFASEVIELTEHALKAVEKSIEFVDDSDGHLGGILDRLQEIHLQACRIAGPDPEELAERLFAWELGTEWDIFYSAVETYAEILGEEGLAVYRRLAEAEWSAVRVLGPGEDRRQTYGKRCRITHIMERLARQAGDVEAVVAIKKRDLSSAYSYLEIAETYSGAGKHDLALEWAERGLKAFPEWPDPRLRQFVADEYHRRGQHDTAMVFAWEHFVESPTLDRYQNLKGHADQSGQWKEWRSRALDFLRQSLAPEKGESADDRRGGTKGLAVWRVRTDHSELVRIFLWEKDVEAAWREACEGGCSDDLWLRLAAKREREHPGDALPIYESEIEPTLSEANNAAYAEAVKLLKKVQDLMRRLGRESEFLRYLASIRAAHKRKRNFMKLLDREKWS